MLKIEQVLRNELGQNVLNDYFESIDINGNNIIVKKDGLTGIYDASTLRKILNCEWDKVTMEGNYFVACKNSQFAVFNREGKTILDCNWDRIILYENGVLVTKDGKQGFIGYNGNKILDCIWKRIEPYKEALLAYKGNGARKVIFDYNGNVKKK